MRHALRIFQKGKKFYIFRKKLRADISQTFLDSEFRFRYENP